MADTEKIGHWDAAALAEIAGQVAEKADSDTMEAFLRYVYCFGREAGAESMAETLAEWTREKVVQAMNQTGKSMVALAVIQSLRKYEERGAIRAGTGRWGGMPGYSKAEIPAWQPGMSDEGGLGPIPQSTIDMIAADIAQNVEQQLEAAQSAMPATESSKQSSKPKRQRPDWLKVVGGADADEKESSESPDGSLGGDSE